MRFYGKSGGNARKIPDSFDQNITLTISFENTLLGKGRWTSNGFFLLKGSMIMQEYLGQNNPGIKSIIEELVADQCVEEYYPYYILTKDIRLYSPSTAAKLVNGNERTGFRDWKYNGKSLGEIINSLE